MPQLGLAQPNKQEDAGKTEWEQERTGREGSGSLVGRDGGERGESMLCPKSCVHLPGEHCAYSLLVQSCPETPRYKEELSDVAGQR